MKKLKIERAIVSVSDKRKLDVLSDYFTKNKIKVYSTGGTYQYLKKISQDLEIQEISDFTKFNEILDGRVKTLHPFIFSGILAKINNKVHQQQIKKIKVPNIDLVVVNLYPFEKVSKNKCSEHECIENIDIGGPSMIRAAAKNFYGTTVLTDPDQYENFIHTANTNQNEIPFEYRKKMASEAFERTSYYESLISNWFNRDLNDMCNSFGSVPLKKIKKLRYGENPHQKASLYEFGDSKINEISGKDLSFNNLNDLEIAMEVVNEFSDKACAIVKHGNPCGVAINKKQEIAYQKALNCDSTSAFGGIVAFNSKVTEEAAKKISKIFTELVVAPDFSPKALKLMKKKKNLILVSYKKSKKFKGLKIKTTKNFLLIQEEDEKKINKRDLVFTTVSKPTASEIDDMIFAFTICKYLNSNAIVVAKNRATVGIGVGQTSRVEAAIQAMKRAKENMKSEKTVLASDGFFPFPDIIKICSKNNIACIIQPGGSKNDQMVIKAANKSNISMTFTGIRHFKH